MTVLHILAGTERNLQSIMAKNKYKAVKWYLIDISYGLNLMADPKLQVLIGRFCCYVKNTETRQLLNTFSLQWTLQIITNDWISSMARARANFQMQFHNIYDLITFKSMFEHDIILSFFFLHT